MILRRSYDSYDKEYFFFLEGGGIFLEPGNVS